ncbi:MAG: Protein of unknown function rane [Frankiales bacterium]|nr:Protein of unknown function rane [Frankiales bacterium]
MSTTTAPRPDVCVSEAAYRSASSRHGVPPYVQDAVWAQLAAGAPSRVRRTQEVLWYGGAAVSLAAMGLFLGTSWAAAGSGTGLLLSLLYLAAFVVVCEVLRARGQRHVAGLLAASAVALVPLTVFAAQETFALWSDRDYGDYGDFFDYISGQWVVMEAATLAVSAVAWRRYRTSFLLLPTAVAGWFATMDLASAVGGEVGSPAVSALVTAVLLGVGLELDRRDLRGEAFWLHLSGLASLAWTLGAGDVDTGVRMLLTGISGGLLLVAGVLLERRLHLTLGALFVFTALSWLAFDVFGGSPVFALVLAALGVGTTVGGVRLDRAVATT